MSMRISDAVLPLLLVITACGGGSDDPRVAAGAVAETQTALGRIACTLGGAVKKDCTVERSATADGQMLTLRGPDGGFHRVQVDADGRGLAAADGAGPAVVTRAGDGTIEIVVGGDHYRLPVTRSTP